MRRVGGLEMAAVASLGLVASLRASPTSSVEIPSPATGPMATELVFLEVHAKSATGEAVLGLSRDDFQVLEDGVPVEVTSFDAVEGGRRMQDEDWLIEGLETQVTSLPVASSEPQSHHILLYVDDANLSAFHRNRLFVPLADFLGRRVAQGDQVMVVSFDGSLTVRQPFTTDAEALLETLIGMSSVPVVDRGPHARNTELAAAIADLERLHGTGGKGPSQPCSRRLVSLAESQARAAAEELRRTLDALGRLVDSLVGLPGRKSLLYLSDGLPLAPGKEAYRLLEQTCGGQGGGPKLAGFDARAAYRELTVRANTSRVSLFTLEASGPRDGGRESLQEALHLMALETGGTAVLNTTEFRRALALVGNHLDTYYSLGYRLRRAEDGAVRSLVVETRRPGVRLEHRRSFQARSSARRLADRTLGHLLLGAEENPLGIKVEVGAATALDGTLFSVPLRLRIPLGKVGLLPRGDSRVGLLRLQVAARDRAGQLAPVRTVEIPLSIPQAQLDQALGKWYLYEVKMLMRAGDHAVAVGLSDEVGQVASFVLAPVPVALRSAEKAR